MVLFVGELTEDAEHLVWDLFFLRGSTITFKIAIGIISLLQEELLQPKNDSFEMTYNVLNNFQLNIDRKTILKDLA